VEGQFPGHLTDLNQLVVMEYKTLMRTVIWAILEIPMFRQTVAGKIASYLNVVMESLTEERSVMTEPALPDALMAVM